MRVPDSLIEITYKVGNDLNLVQGPGGNISFKDGGILLIKASGTKMADVKKKNIFVEVNLNKIISAMNRNEKDPLKNSYDKNLDIRPSIETTMHAIMPHRYVLHVHCVNTLSVVVQKKFKKKLAQSLKNINWISVPYIKPGIDLSNALREPIKTAKPDVIFLANHGVIAGAETATEVFQIINSISQKLSFFIGEKYPFNINKLNPFLIGTGYKLPKYKEVHQLALSDTYSSKVLKGTLFPDQAVFLKDGIVIKNTFEEINKISNIRNNNLPVILIPRVGTIVPKCFKEANEDNLLGLCMTILRIPRDAEINYLTKEDKNDLINWDLEKYRQKINT